LRLPPDITIADVNPSTGRVEADSIIALVKDNTRLITVMHANNETGVIMPISEIGKRLKGLNEERMRKGLPRVLLHTDAAQTIGKHRVDVKELQVDYLTIVGHKVWYHGGRLTISNQSSISNRSIVQRKYIFCEHEFVLFCTSFMLPGLEPFTLEISVRILRYSQFFKEEDKNADTDLELKTQQ
jgi:Cys-tRNA synthase (O-phospho-L-seryl-tRNA:Cys-tRNA synthase)